MKIVAKAGFKPGNVDLSSQLASLRKAGVDLVVLGTIVRETVAAYAGARKIGWNVKMITSIPGRNQIVTAIARKTKINIDGLYGVGQWKIHGANTDMAGVKAWMGKYAAKYKQPPLVTAMVAYSLMDWTIKGLEKAGRDLTTEKFVKAMQSIKYTDMFGSPTLSLAKGNHAEPQAVAIDQVKNGSWKRVTPVITNWR
jgi:ABC-type branched-subunit amino acid transport system substrate-binding protein